MGQEGKGSGAAEAMLGDRGKRNKEKGTVSLESEDGVGTAQAVRAFLSQGATLPAHQASQAESNTRLSD